MGRRWQGGSAVGVRSLHQVSHGDLRVRVGEHVCEGRRVLRTPW